jgi:tRNA pseudouridine32 synthase/23S rRNA pseudouridine746 synthase
MNKGEVADEKGARLKADSHYHQGAFVYYYRELEQETPIPFEERIVYRDEHIVVADKPHYLPVIPSGRFLRETLLVRLKKRLNLEYLVPIHRIDSATAGLVVFSHNLKTRSVYASLFNEYQVKKTYEALAPFPPRIGFPLTHRSRLVRGEPFFRMKEVEGIPNSETVINILENMGDIALYQLTPVTGRKHQLRVHCASLGIPIINDRLYPVLQPFDDNDFSKPLQLLAKSISLQDPLTRHVRCFQSKRRLSHTNTSL